MLVRSEDTKPYDDKILGKEIKLEDNSELAKRLLDKYGDSARNIAKRVIRAAQEENLRNFHKKETKTDLEKWETFLTEMHIPFKVEEGSDYDMHKKEHFDAIQLYIGVTESLAHDLETKEYCNLFDYGTDWISITFNKDGSFRYFSALGC